MNIFRYKGIRMLVAVVLILFGAWIVTANTNNDLAVSITNTLAYPFRKLGFATQQTLNNGESYDEIVSKNEELQSEVNELRGQLADYHDIKRENEQLRKYYDIKETNSDFKLIPANIISKDPDWGIYEFTLDCGTIAGVTKNSPVLTENGLIGYVSQADITSCTVTTVLSDKAQISVIDKKTADTGILTGNPSLAGESKAIIKLLDEKSKPEKGDIIATSGMGEIFPADLLIGTVDEIKYDEYDSSKYAVVSLYDNIDALSEVVVLVNPT